MTVTPITSFTEFQQIIASDTPCVIDFWAEWCGPCRVISPIFEKIAEKTEGVDFYKVDVDAQPEISQEVGIRAMPTFIAFKSGQKIDSVLGAIPPQVEALVVKAASSK